MSSLLRSFGITNALPAFASILPGTGGAGDVYVADQHNQRTRSSDPCLRPRRWRAGGGSSGCFADAELESRPPDHTTTGRHARLSDEAEMRVAPRTAADCSPSWGSR
jgi:hypothetical protein